MCAISRRGAFRPAGSLGVGGFLWLVCGLWLLARTSHAAPQAATPTAGSSSALRSSDAGIPELGSAQPALALEGQPIRRVEFVTVGGRWRANVGLPWLARGQALSSELVQRAIHELTSGGRYASVEAEAEADAGGVTLRFLLEPRRLVSSVRIVEGLLPVDETLQRAALHTGGEVTAAELPRIAQRVREFYSWRGFPNAQVSVEALDLDDPLAVVVLISVRAGAPATIIARRFRVLPPATPERLRAELDVYATGRGDRADETSLARNDAELAAHLRRRGWFNAQVSHRRMASSLGGTVLEVFVAAGPEYRIRLQGNMTFDASALEQVLRTSDSEDISLSTRAERLREYYRVRGFLDVEVSASERGAPADAVHDLVFVVREHEPVRVVGREYACLGGKRVPEEIGAEIDGFLSEKLPGAGIFSSVDPNVVDQTLSPSLNASKSRVPFELNPWRTYVPDVYTAAMKHLKELYRSQGYLSAEVGPVQLLRRACAPTSPPNQCLPLGQRRSPAASCSFDEVGLPREEPPLDPTLACRPDPSRGLSCEANVVLHIPVKLGPRTLLADVEFAGNDSLPEADLLAVTELDLGNAVAPAEIDRARQRVLEAYAEEGFAFAEVDTQIDVSGDHTRGHVRFSINEGERVRVARIVVRGAFATSESLIRRRLALQVGEPYRRSLVRTTEERLATLGIFSSVAVGFEDPYVPAREKVIVISVQERRPQYLDVRPGFSTGEGFRITFEYGHRNLGGQAIQLTLLSQLGYLPTPFIIEGDVRAKYDALDVGQRLERRNSATAEFPEIGLGPLFRLNAQGIDVRDNARDFGLTKDAGILTLIYRPAREFSVQLGGSLERNVTNIFSKDALGEYIRTHPELVNSFRAPDGTTAVIAERTALTWDRRDQPLNATRGTLFSVELEHVHATPLADNDVAESDEETVFDAIPADFLRTSGRVAGYVPLVRGGPVLALSLRAGVITQLMQDSRTYPDRLFFLGGVDSLRGFLQESLVPEDRAQTLLDPRSTIELAQILVRGGDAFLNPRLELRFPVSPTIQTALFADAGNLWTDPTFAPFRLRYAIGTGLRVATPVGPLVFDYGFNVDRVLDGLLPSRPKQRTWEDLGAFHFSVGVF